MTSERMGEALANPIEPHFLDDRDFSGNMVAMIRCEGNTGKRNPKEKITAPGQRRKKKAQAGSRAGREALVHQRRELVPPFLASQKMPSSDSRQEESNGQTFFYF
jgi:LDH2 family malate/lactate/ureidoglycolate dehydrogenase